MNIDGWWEDQQIGLNSLGRLAVTRNGAGRGILIVDDEAAIAETLGVIFSKNGYDVRVAYSAEEAIETIAAWQPDLAILDVMLPRMNGIDLAIVLRSNHPCCRLLLFSGHHSTQDLLEEAAKKGHMFDILAKPVHPAFMLDAVSDLLGDHPKGTA